MPASTTQATTTIRTNKAESKQTASMNHNGTATAIASAEPSRRSTLLKRSSPMRASVIRVDSPVRAPRESAADSETSTTQRAVQNLRTPLAELSTSTMNGMTTTTTTFTPVQSRRLTMPPISATSLRKVSGDRTDGPVRSNVDLVQGVTTISENDSPQWSSAVGHATTSGKSGRVIERLMAENDRLKKDLELQLLRSQELERNLQTMRPQLDALRAENSNLSHLKSVEGDLLSRRERKIDSLKEELATERARREASDALVRKTMTERDDMAETARRDVQQAQDEAKHSMLHATILEQSHRQLASDYRLRAQRWRKDVDNIDLERKAEQQKLAKLEIVAGTMRTELERTRKVHADFSSQFDKYKSNTEQWFKELEQVAMKETSRSRNLSDEMQEVVQKMRWVIANHERLKAEEEQAKNRSSKQTR